MTHSDEYPTFAEAWAGIAGEVPPPPDLLPPAPRYLATFTDCADAPEFVLPYRLPIPLTAAASGNRVLRSGSITAVFDSSAAPPPAAAVWCMTGDLKARASTRLQFNLHWARELEAGEFKADIGLAVDAGASLALEANIRGEYVAALAPGNGGLRFRMWRRLGGSAAAAASVSVGARLESAVPQSLSELAAAILGTHTTQWLASLTAAGLEAIAAQAGIDAALLARVLQRWRALDAGVARVVAAALGTAERLCGLRAWLEQVAAAAGDTALREAVLLGALPGGTANDAGGLLDAVCGSRLAALTDSGALERVQDTAIAVLRLLSDSEAGEVLARLREAEAAARAAILPDAPAPQRLAGLVAQAYENAAAAVSKRQSVEWNWRCGRTWRDEALLDCTVEPDGLALVTAAAAGDLRPLLDAAERGRARLREAVLTHGIGGYSSVDLTLPFIGGRDSKRLWEALASARVEVTDSGRLITYAVRARDKVEQRNVAQSTLALSGVLVAGARSSASLTLDYAGSRKVKAALAPLTFGPVIEAYGFPQTAAEWLGRATSEVEATLTLSIDGSAATAWLDAPSRENADSMPVYGAMASAVQRVMRLWLPQTYFAEVGRYRDLMAAWPLLVYQCTKPCPGPTTADLTYDIMDIGQLRVARQHTHRAVAAELKRVSSLLYAAGYRRAGNFYADLPAAHVIDAVGRSPINFNALISADTMFVNGLMELCRKGRAARQAMTSEPDRAVRRLANFAADLARQFNRRLRRLYGGETFTAIGSLLFVEATQAISGGNSPATISGVLRLRSGAGEQVFTNAAFRP